MKIYASTGLGLLAANGVGTLVLDGKDREALAWQSLGFFLVTAPVFFLLDYVATRPDSQSMGLLGLTALMHSHFAATIE